jgi:hypothetical protein
MVGEIGEGSFRQLVENKMMFGQGILPTAMITAWHIAREILKRS